MTLFAVTTDGQEHQWHKNCYQEEGSVLRALIEENGCDILLVQADGDELDLINDKFTGIRKAPGKRVVRWFGEDAKFIVENL